MTYEELKQQYEKTLKKVGLGISRLLYFNVVFAILWGCLALSEEKIAKEYSLYILLSIIILAVWRFSYFNSERQLDKDLVEATLQGVDYEKNHPQLKNSFFVDRLAKFKPLGKIVTRLMFLFFLMMSFKIALFLWVKFHYPEKLSTIKYVLKPFTYAYYGYFGWIISQPFTRFMEEKKELKSGAS